MTPYARMTSPVWYAISARSLFAFLSPPAYLEALLDSSAGVVQWREKDMPVEVSRPLIRMGGELARAAGKVFLVNGAYEAGLLEGADGVHLTSSQEVGPVLAARVRAGRPEFLIGKSVHSVDETRKAEEEGADYILLGPVFDPLSKEATRAPIGLQVLREAVRKVSIPVIALGGIEKANAARVLATGVAGVAGISWVRSEVGCVSV